MMRADKRVRWIKRLMVKGRCRTNRRAWTGGTLMKLTKECWQGKVLGCSL